MSGSLIWWWVFGILVLGGGSKIISLRLQLEILRLVCVIKDYVLKIVFKKEKRKLI